MSDWVEFRPRKRAIVLSRPNAIVVDIESILDRSERTRTGRHGAETMRSEEDAGKSGGQPIRENRIAEMNESGHMVTQNEETRLSLSPTGHNSENQTPKSNRNEFSRAVDNLLELMERYKVPKWKLAKELDLSTSDDERHDRNPPSQEALDEAFDQWIAVNRQKRVDYFPRTVTAPIARLLSKHGADELCVYRSIMVSRGAGSLAWLLQSRAGLMPTHDEEIALALGLSNKWKLINLYRTYRKPTQSKEFTEKLAKYLASRPENPVPEAETYNALLGVVPTYDTVASETVIRVPILEREDWLRIDWETRGGGLSDIEQIMVDLLSRPGMAFEKMDESETNPTSVFYRAEDDFNAPDIRKGSRVQIDLSKTQPEHDGYFLIIVQTKTGREPLLRKYDGKNGGAFVAGSKKTARIPWSSKIRIAGTAWSQITNWPFSKS